jgi:hypothetical protein
MSWQFRDRQKLGILCQKAASGKSLISELTLEINKQHNYISMNHIEAMKFMIAG